MNVNLQQNSQLRETAVSISVLWVWLSRNITINTFKFHFVFYSGFHITQTFVTINLQHFILLHFFCYNFYPQTFHAILFNFQDSSATFQRENFHFCFHKTWQIGVKFNQKVVVWKALNANVPPLRVSCELRNWLFSAKIKFLAKCKREFTTKFAISPNAC